MARKRMIHRDIFQSYDMAKCNHRQRLLFIGLITNADDRGRLKGEESILMGDIFPFDKILPKTIREDLEYLDNIGLIHYYKINDVEKYIQIIHWSDYQKIDHLIESKIPVYMESDSRNNREIIANETRIDRENFSPNCNPNCNYNSNPNENSDKGSIEPISKGKEKYQYAIGIKKENEWNKTKEVKPNDTNYGFASFKDIVNKSIVIRKEK